MSKIFHSLSNYQSTHYVKTKGEMLQGRQKQILLFRIITADALMHTIA